VKWKMALLALLCIFVGFSVLAWWRLSKEDQINRSSYQQILLGSTLNEVEAVLGGPGVYYSMEWAARDLPLRARPLTDIQAEGLLEENPDNEEPGRTRVWSSLDAVLLIHLDQEGRVDGKGILTYTPLTRTERIRHRLRWLFF
jgi:hypothetical protein